MQLIFNMVLNVLLMLCGVIIAVHRRRRASEEKLLAVQERFFDELAGRYARYGDMREALEESVQSCNGELQQEILQMLGALEEEHAGEGGYHGENAKNTYFLLLFSLCHTIRAFGDLKIQGVSLFVHNLRYIKEEVRLELLRRQEGRYAFLGLTTLSMMPFFICIPIQMWSISISLELGRFYTGAYGFVTLMVCFFLTLFCVLGVQQLQYPMMHGAGSETFARKLLEIPMLAAAIDTHISHHYSRYLKKNEALKVLQGFGNVREFLVKKLMYAFGVAGLVCAIQMGYLMTGGEGIGANTVTKAFFLAMIVITGVMGYFLPDIGIIILQERVEQQKMEETLRFETLILIVMHYSRITVEEILRWMERFSVIFARALQRAADDFSYRRRESLEQLKEELSYDPVKKIADALIVCDDIPVAQAFYDLESDRAYNLEKYSKKVEELQREKAALARLIAFFPFIAVLALRLVIPFVLEGLTQLGSY